MSYRFTFGSQSALSFLVSRANRNALRRFMFLTVASWRACSCLNAAVNRSNQLARDP
jgi:hypothetical protein